MHVWLWLNIAHRSGVLFALVLNKVCFSAPWHQNSRNRKHHWACTYMSFKQLSTLKDYIPVPKRKEEYKWFKTGRHQQKNLPLFNQQLVFKHFSFSGLQMVQINKFPNVVTQVGGRRTWYIWRFMRKCENSWRTCILITGRQEQRLLLTASFIICLQNYCQRRLKMASIFVWMWTNCSRLENYQHHLSLASMMGHCQIPSQKWEKFSKVCNILVF